MIDKFSTATDGKTAKDAGFTTGMGGKTGFDGSINFTTGCIDTKTGGNPLQDVNKRTPECGELGGC